MRESRSIAQLEVIANPTSGAEANIGKEAGSAIRSLRNVLLFQTTERYSRRYRTPCRLDLRQRSLIERWLSGKKRQRKCLSGGVYFHSP